ncbi:hypothetical protein NC516_09150 [Latilactobacillus sakei]|uniref:hypothetical protein n=1 Tax=Latilactobacillus sakei TaxID=1599 RepID=UPI0020928442|nr:hypothetical protein [Latilactobacillus sakei]USS38534.1 hypothetical protein NC516_09150 [Latilactobacillus sakei]
MVYKLRYVCENCGKIGFFHDPEEAFDLGWDYPPKMGQYHVIGPRTCGNCAIDKTLYWAMINGTIKSPDDMTPNQKAVLTRILTEPDSITINKDDDFLYRFV